MPFFSDRLVQRTKEFSDEVDRLAFSFGGYVYNPLSYAWAMHEAYLRRYVHQGADVFFLGMNPGPFGMAQTGVPFGEVSCVRDWMKLDEPVGKPPAEHPARPVLGLAIGRSEVSGKRLWSMVAERFGTPERFFSSHTVMNYCPLVFVDAGKTGRNIIPEKLPREERIALESLCDAYLDEVITLLGPRHLVGVGRYAQRKLAEAAARTGTDATVTSILHPSPGNPQANAGWSAVAIGQLREARIW